VKLTPEQEYRLIRAAHGGERESLRELEAYLFPTVRNVATRTLIAEQTSISAHDLIQEGFLALFDDGWRVLMEFNPQRGPLLPWVAFVLARSFVSYLRGGARTGRREKVHEPEKLAFLADRNPVQTNVEARDVLRHVLSELRSVVSAEVWMVFVMVFVDGLAINEIVQATGLSRVAIDGRIHRARKVARTIRDRIEKESPVERPLAGGEDE
jgi:RNA polymerase sigma factor (sigma-70 family)